MGYNFSKDSGNAMNLTGSYEVAHHEGTYFLKLSGYLTYTQCGPLSSFLDEICDKDNYQNVLVDLRDAQLIDSTNIGLLARLALDVKKKFGQPLTMISTAPAVTQALRTTGLHHLAILLDTPDSNPPPQEQIQALPDAQKK